MVSEKEFLLSGKESGLSRGAATEGGGWDDSEDFVVAGSFFWKTKTSSAWHYIWLHPFRSMALDPGNQLRVE